MKSSYFFAVVLAVLSSAHLAIAESSPCTWSLGVSGFSSVKSEKSFFYSQPSEKKVKKSYLVARNWVQILGKPKGLYSCLIYRNYQGRGGKQTTGWVLTDSLEPIRRKLERKDLTGIWNKEPYADESYTIDISDRAGKFEITLNSYLHDHPGEVYQVGSVQESDGHLLLTHLKGSAGAPKQMEIEYGKIGEPGTINLLGPEGWAGVYHR